MMLKFLQVKVLPILFQKKIFEFKFFDKKLILGHAIRVLANEASFRDQSADTGLTMKLLALLGAEEMIVRRQAVLSVAQLIQNHPTNKGIVLANKVRVPNTITSSFYMLIFSIYSSLKLINVHMMSFLNLKYREFLLL